MSKKVIWVLIIILILIIAIAIFGYFFLQTPTGQKFVQDNGLSIFMPFGNQDLPPITGGTGGGLGVSTTTLPSTELPSTEPLPKLRKIWASPTAGAIIFSKNNTSDIRFTDRSTGHIYEMLATDREPERISNTTIPKVYEAVWSPDGNTVYARYLKGETSPSIETYEIKLASTTGQDFIGTFLPKNISSLATNPAGDKAFYLSRETAGATGYVWQKSGKSRINIFSSLLSEWLASWPNDTFILLTNKPSGTSPGFAYLLNSKTSEIKKIAEGFKGLTALANAKADLALIGGNGLTIGTWRQKDNSLNSLPISTLPEKCVWKDDQAVYCAVPDSIPEGVYPDSWYRGAVSFRDSLWEVNTATLTTNLTISLSLTAGEDFDVISPVLSPDKKSLIFINKKDLSLWLLELQ
ncbi:MAG: hypothetical protein WC250_03585 [Candidatus Paceibacterota bacterium]|jgi:hypothetical protein